MIDAVFTKELALKTHTEGWRNWRGRDRQRLPGSSGGRGDFTAGSNDRRIFEMSASGLSNKATAHQLNAEGILSPQPQHGRIGRSWCVSRPRPPSEWDRKSTRRNFVSCRMTYLPPSGSDEKVPQACGEGKTHRPRERTAKAEVFVLWAANVPGTVEGRSRRLVAAPRMPERSMDARCTASAVMPSAQIHCLFRANSWNVSCYADCKTRCSGRSSSITWSSALGRNWSDD
jgi:hypothetical protein